MLGFCLYVKPVHLFKNLYMIIVYLLLLILKMAIISVYGRIVATGVSIGMGILFLVLHQGSIRRRL